MFAPGEVRHGEIKFSNFGVFKNGGKEFISTDMEERFQKFGKKFFIGPQFAALSEVSFLISLTLSTAYAKLARRVPLRLRCPP
jgi:hypothetical protein